jgi:hypothetical protein
MAIASRDTVQYQALLAFPVLDGVLYRTVLWQPCVGTGRPQRLDRMITTAIPIPPSAALRLVEALLTGTPTTARPLVPRGGGVGIDSRDSRIARQRQRPTLPAPLSPWPSLSLAAL